MEGRQRPLSPFWIYRWQVTMWLSSLHRITGLCCRRRRRARRCGSSVRRAGPRATRACRACLARRGSRCRSRAGHCASFSICRMACAISCGIPARGFEPRASARPAGRVIAVTRDRHRRVRLARDSCRGATVSLVTPLNRVLGLGTAKGAGEHWWMQRVTAVALVPLGCGSPSLARAAGLFVLATVSAGCSVP